MCWTSGMLPLCLAVVLAQLARRVLLGQTVSRTEWTCCADLSTQIWQGSMPAQAVGQACSRHHAVYQVGWQAGRHRADSRQAAARLPRSESKFPGACWGMDLCTVEISVWLKVQSCPGGACPTPLQGSPVAALPRVRSQRAWLVGPDAARMIFKLEPLE